MLWQIGFSIALCALGALGWLSVYSTRARFAAVWAELSALRTNLDQSPSQSLQQRLTSMEEALAALATSVKMSKVRQAGIVGERNGSRMPDPYTDPDGWRSAMNAKLGASRVPQ